MPSSEKVWFLIQPQRAGYRLMEMFKKDGNCPEGCTLTEGWKIFLKDDKSSIWMENDKIFHKDGKLEIFQMEEDGKSLIRI